METMTGDAELNKFDWTASARCLKRLDKQNNRNDSTDDLPDGMSER